MNYGLCLTRAALTLAALFAGVQPAYAGMYRWVDEDGRVHYSDTIPADKGRLGYTVYDGEGRQISVVEPAKTAEERAAAQKQAARATEQDRKDRILLATFTREEDLNLVRDERLATLDSALTLQQEKLADLRQQYADIEAQAAIHQAEQKPLPEDLASRLEDLRVRIRKFEADLTVKQEHKRATEETFAADLARYRELKGLPAE